MVNVLYEPRFYQQLGDDEFLRLWILFLFYQLLRDFLRLRAEGIFDSQPTVSICAKPHFCTKSWPQTVAEIAERFLV
jgi:hypothetical protein